MDVHVPHTATRSDLGNLRHMAASTDLGPAIPVPGIITVADYACAVLPCPSYVHPATGFPKHIPWSMLPTQAPPYEKTCVVGTREGGRRPVCENLAPNVP